MEFQPLLYGWIFCSFLRVGVSRQLFHIIKDEISLLLFKSYFAG